MVVVGGGCAIEIIDKSLELMHIRTHVSPWCLSPLV